MGGRKEEGKRRETESEPVNPAGVQANDGGGGGQNSKFGGGRWEAIAKGLVACNSEASRGVWGHDLQKILNLDPLRSLLVHFQTICGFQMT